MSTPNTYDLNFLLTWAIKEKEDKGMNYAHFNPITFACNTYKSLEDYNNRMKLTRDEKFSILPIDSYIERIKNELACRNQTTIKPQPPIEQSFLFLYNATAYVRPFYKTIKAYSIDEAKSKFKDFCITKESLSGKAKQTNHVIKSISIIKEEKGN
jgi:hypothetical protein